MKTPLDSSTLQFRKENFKARVERASNPMEKGEIYLEISHNGFQSIGFTLLQGEIDLVIGCLEHAKKRLK